MSRLKIGDLVILIGCDGCMPPLGAYGEIVGELDNYGDHEVLFPNYSWQEIMGSLADSPTWEIPAKWLMKINHKKENIEIEIKEELPC